MLNVTDSLPKKCDKYFTVSCKEDEKYYQKLQQKYKGMRIMSQEGLMVCVLQQYLNLKNFMLK